MILISLQLYFNLKSSPCEVGLKLTADNFSPTGGSMNRAGQSFYVRAILKRGKLLNSQFVQQRWWHKRWSGGNTSERAGLESRDKLGFFIWNAVNQFLLHIFKEVSLEDKYPLFTFSISNHWHRKTLWIKNKELTAFFAKQNKEQRAF